MAKHDVEELFDLVETGDEVRIITTADPETAEIFGSAVVQTAAEEAALTTTNTMPPATAAVPLEQ